MWLLVRNLEGEHTAVQVDSLSGRDEYGPITTKGTSSFVLERDEYGKIPTQGSPSITAGPSGDHDVVAVGHESAEGILFEALTESLPEGFFGEFSLQTVVEDIDIADANVEVREAVRIQSEEPSTLRISRASEEDI